jgi:phospholipid transport system substrate-binding protein
MKRTSILKLAIAALSATMLLFATAGPSAAGTAQASTVNEDPARFIETLAAQAIATLNDRSGSLEDRESKFRQLLRNEFAMTRIARFVVGVHWRNMTRDERRRYISLFSEWVLKTYASRLGGYAGQSFKVTKTSEAGRGDIIVHSRIDQSDGASPVRCNWRVRRQQGKLKIIDIYVEGISMAVTQRSEFAAIIKSKGVRGLLQQMESRLEQLTAL